MQHHKSYKFDEEMTFMDKFFYDYAIDVKEKTVVSLGLKPSLLFGVVIIIAALIFALCA